MASKSYENSSPKQESENTKKIEKKKKKSKTILEMQVVTLLYLRNSYMSPAKRISLHARV